MKRAAFLAGLFFAAQAVWAQQQEQSKPAPAPNPPESTQTNSSSQSNNTRQGQTPAAAPQLGHPLDPADVDILTGKADRAARGNVAGNVPSMYGYGGTSYGRQSYGAGSTKTSPPFVPLAFGNVNGRSFVVIGSTSGARAPFFLAPRGFGRFGSFFFLPW